ncbi:unnamed protein product, partial [Polarella glacialis]
DESPRVKVKQAVRVHTPPYPFGTPDILGDAPPSPQAGRNLIDASRIVQTPKTQDAALPQQEEKKEAGRNLGAASSFQQVVWQIDSLQQRLVEVHAEELESLHQ